MSHEVNIIMGKVGNTEITLVQGDITEQACDALVNAANNQLWMGAGVAGALKRRGGRAIEQEALTKGPIPIGESVVTGAGKLAARYVIHAAVMGTDLQTDAAKIHQATLSALARADELSLRCIAFPALGTGVGGFPQAEAARVMFDAVKIHLSQAASSLREIRFVLFSSEAIDIWRHVIDDPNKRVRFFNNQSGG